MRVRESSRRAPAPSATRRAVVPAPLAGAVAGVLGVGALLLVTSLLRGELGVRTLPEVLAEGATFYLPQRFFEYMINTYRGQAKVFLMYGIFAFLALAGALIGLVYARWPRPRMAVALAGVAWLFTLLVALPASGEGLFGGDSRAGELPTLAAYAAGWAAFGGTLAAAYSLLRRRGTRAARQEETTT